MFFNGLHIYNNKKELLTLSRREQIILKLGILLLRKLKTTEMEISATEPKKAASSNNRDPGGRTRFQWSNFCQGLLQRFLLHPNNRNQHVSEIPGDQ